MYICISKSTKIVKKIALLTGGYGDERSISLKSAAFVEDNIDSSLFEVFVIHIDRDRWYHRDSTEAVDRNDFSLSLNGRKIEFDLVFIMIHGDPAENGRIQGYFEGLNIPITTCDTFVSALTFNKYICNLVLAEYGVISAKSILVRSTDDWKKMRLADLGFPLFVKPNNNGSSYGISKVDQESKLDDAFSFGFKYDNELIIEEFIKGREFTCGAIRLKDEIITFPITEIISHNAYFDFEAKYENASDEITPADLSQELTHACQAITRRIYKSLNCHGMIRADFILKDGTFYLIEVNTIPGMTPQSLYPQQVRAHGWTVEQLLTKLFNQCLVHSA